MQRLTSRLPDFGAEYSGDKMRAMVRQLEQRLAQIRVDTSRAAYSVTTNTTLTDLDDIVLADTTSGDLTITLPEISEEMVLDKREYEIVKPVAANTLTIAPSGTDTTVGDTDVVVTVQWTALRFRATTGNWILI